MDRPSRTLRSLDPLEDRRSEFHPSGQPETTTNFDNSIARSLDIRLPGLHLRRFALHRPAADRSVLRVAPGRCSRALFFPESTPHHTDSLCRRPEAGTVLVLPPGSQDERCHDSGKLPFCLALDFEFEDSGSRSAATGVVPREELLQAREQLSHLLRLQADGTSRAWESALVVLNLLVMLLRTAGWLRSQPASVPTPGETAMHRLLLTMPLESPLGAVVERSGYQRDHLNRLIKRQTGLTLGQFRTHRRLERAKELLAQGVKVGDVAGEIGLPDQSYFARWFRRQTGLAPTQWLETQRLKPRVPLALCG